MKDIGLSYALATFSLSTNLLFTLIKKNLITKSEAIQLIKPALSMQEHPFPSMDADACKFSDELLQMVEKMIHSLPS